MAKIIYHYHPQTSIFLGTTEADESPLEPGVFLLPAHATEAQPPVAGDREAAVFGEDGWTLQPDWRGTVYYTADGARHEITALGETPPADALDAQPAPTEDQLAVAARVKRDGLLRSVVDAINAVRWATMSAAEQAAWTAYRRALLDVPDQAGFPTGIDWPAMPGSEVA